jgi:hypothetical protein
MRSNRILVVTAVVLLAVAGYALSQDKSPQRTRPKLTSPHEAQTVASSSVKAAADFPVIGYLEKRDRTITIKAGPKCPLYSVKAADGRILCENLSKEQLSAQAPELGEFLKRAIADTSCAKADARVRIKMDASVWNDARR